MVKILVVDDEKNICDYIEKRITDYLARVDEDAEISVFYDSAPLLEASKKANEFDIIFLDIKMKTIKSLFMMDIKKAFTSDIGSTN